jgi:iron complex transport system substrate-binding protein
VAEASRAPGRPRRVVSLAPGLTEFLLAIGAGDCLVGVSDYCVLPEGRRPARLGGTGNPDIDQLHKLKPDLVLVDRSAGGQHASPALDAGQDVFELAARSVGDAITQLADLAQAIGAARAATALLGELRAAHEQALEQSEVRPTRRTLGLIWRDPWLAIGGDTYAADLLRLCGAENVALRLPGRSPRAGLDTFMHHNPEVILLGSGPYPFEDDDLRAFWRFGDVAAVVRRRVYRCDARLLMQPGPHIPEALATIAALIARDER